MRIEPLGDSAYILSELQRPAYAIADELNSRDVPGLLEANACYDTVGVYVDPLEFDPSFLSTIPEAGPTAAVEGPVHKIPVCFSMGEDLSIVAAQLAMSAEELQEDICRLTLRCYGIGFCPGFPYLGYLPEPYEVLERLESPRLRVPAGSVALSGRQAGIYTIERPGGWRIIGRTPLKLVDVKGDYFPIKAGDQVRFVPISFHEFRNLEGTRL